MMVSVTCPFPATAVGAVGAPGIVEAGMVVALIVALLVEYPVRVEVIVMVAD